ncbi:putative mafB-like protein [Neisseria meningitidis NM3141]|nr:putative mafB-like protein [Neisseria meningitidis NM3141]
MVGLSSTFLPPQTVVAASATARAVWAVAVIFGWASAHCLAELMPSFTAKALSCNRLAAASCASGLKFPNSLISCKVCCAEM